MDTTWIAVLGALALLGLCALGYWRYRLHSETSGRDDRYSPERLMTQEQAQMLDYLQDTFPGQVVLPNVSLKGMLAVRRAVNRKRAEERLTQLRQVLRCRARPMVTHADHDAVLLACGADLDRLAHRVEAQGIAQQVVHRALQHIRPAVELQVAFQLNLNLLLGRIQVRVVLQFVQQLAEVDWLRRARFGVEAGEGEDFTDQRFQAVALLTQARPVFFPFGSIRALGQRQSDAQARQW